MTAVLQQLLQNTTNPDVLGQLMTPEARYVSFNFENSELKKIMPWAGTHKGAQSLPKVFAGIQSFWKTLDFMATDTIEQDNRVAFFGSFNSLLAIRIRRGRGAGVPSAGEEKQIVTLSRSQNRQNRESSQGGLNYVRHRGSHGTRRVGRGQGVASQEEAGEGDRARRQERRDLVKAGSVLRHVPRECALHQDTKN